MDPKDKIRQYYPFLYAIARKVIRTLPDWRSFSSKEVVSSLIPWTSSKRWLSLLDDIDALTQEDHITIERCLEYANPIDSEWFTITYPSLMYVLLYSSEELRKSCVIDNACLLVSTWPSSKYSNLLPYARSEEMYNLLTKPKINVLKLLRKAANINNTWLINYTMLSITDSRTRIEAVSILLECSPVIAISYPEASHSLYKLVRYSTTRLGIDVMTELVQLFFTSRPKDSVAGGILRIAAHRGYHSLIDIVLPYVREPYYSDTRLSIDYVSNSYVTSALSRAGRLPK